MPLFECSRCGAVENTALGEYWVRVIHEKKPPLCSECATGEWHGQWRKRTVVEAGYVHGKTGHLYKPAELEQGGYFYGKDARCDCGDVQAHYVRPATPAGEEDRQR